MDKPAGVTSFAVVDHVRRSLLRALSRTGLRAAAAAGAAAPDRPASSAATPAPSIPWPPACCWSWWARARGCPLSCWGWTRPTPPPSASGPPPTPWTLTARSPDRRRCRRSAGVVDASWPRFRGRHPAGSAGDLGPEAGRQAPVQAGARGRGCGRAGAPAGDHPPAGDRRPCAGRGAATANWPRGRSDGGLFQRHLYPLAWPATWPWPPAAWAHLQALRRLQVGPFAVDDAVAGVHGPGWRGPGGGHAAAWRRPCPMLPAWSLDEPRPAWSAQGGQPAAGLAGSPGRRRRWSRARPARMFRMVDRDGDLVAVGRLDPETGTAAHGGWSFPPTTKTRGGRHVRLIRLTEDYIDELIAGQHRSARPPAGILRPDHGFLRRPAPRAPGPDRRRADRPADRLGLAAGAIFTFMQHPRLVLDAEPEPFLLTTWREKLSLLQEAGLRGDRGGRFLSRPGPAGLPRVRGQVPGRLPGHEAPGGRLRRAPGRRPRGARPRPWPSWAQELGYHHGGVCRRCGEGEQIISSSAIREAVLAGDMPLAAAMLGRPYALWGEVTPGRQPRPRASASPRPTSSPWTR